jgi:hypothetical protein
MAPARSRWKGRVVSVLAWPIAAGGLQNAGSELDNVGLWLAERGAELLQHVGFHLANWPVADGPYGGRDATKPWQQQAGKCDDPLATLLGCPLHEFIDHGSFNRGRRGWMQ